MLILTLAGKTICFINTKIRLRKCHLPLSQYSGIPLYINGLYKQCKESVLYKVAISNLFKVETKIKD